MTAAAVIRLTAFAALCLFASLQWIRQVEPADTTAAVLWTVIATAVAALMLAARRRPLAIIPILFAALVLVLLACGLSADHLRPREWDALMSGIGQGLEALPDLRVPYRGVDEWVRLVVLAGGGVLALSAAMLVFAARSALPAGMLLAVLYGVPIVERGPDSPFLNGALFAVLFGALLWGDKVRERQLPLAGGLTASAVVIGLLLAPRLDASEPWIDYRNLAGDLAQKNSVRFDWRHRYTPLKWPRQGEEVLRVKAPSASYWKGITLERFDGVAWRFDPRFAATAEEDTEMTVAHPEWLQRVTVVARGIRSRELYAPGDVIAVEDLGRPTEPAPGGTRVIPEGSRPLGPGDGYRADVYTPKPTPFELSTAGTDYPRDLLRFTQIELPETVGGPPVPSPRVDPATIHVPFFGNDDDPILLSALPLLGVEATGRETLLASDYARVLRLAESLKEGAETPYQLVQRVMRRVRQNARYTESPPTSRLPLVDFLFRTRLGYCQQFSGAMTLLLRMAGVPARVAEGFAPGFFDRDRQEHVVRDYDAHSWVEVYFPQLGWVAFDPTPSSAPPASQAGDSAPSAALGDSRDRGGPQPASAPTPSAAPEQDGGTSVWLFVGAAFLLTALGGLAMALYGRRGGGDGPPELVELRRALERTGRAPSPETTLHAIEAGFAGDREAQAYVRALRLSRFAARPAPPTPSQRAALRRALAAGLGMRGRLGAWLAMPPRAGEMLRRRSYNR